MQSPYVIVISLTLLASSAQAAPLTVQFTGHVTGADDEAPVRTGARMFGYFTYDPQSPPGLQSANRPMLVIDIPEHQFLLEWNAFYIGVRDNWLDAGVSVPGDGLLVTYSDPAIAFEGGVALYSYDLTLFSGDRLPATLPRLERFDVARGVTISYDRFGIEWTAICRIDALAAAGSHPTDPLWIYARQGSSEFLFRAAAVVRLHGRVHRESRFRKLGDPDERPCNDATG